MRSLKRIIVGTLANCGGPALSYGLMMGRATVFMLHRFDCPEAGVHGHDLRILRSALAYLRRKRYELVSLRELYARLASGAQSIRGAVAFTIDDGYFDHAQVASPLFAEFDCPVTTFVTTGFLDKKLWFWWDQIEHIFESANLPNISVTIGSTNLRYEMAGLDRRTQGKIDFTNFCKGLKTEDRHVAIARLAGAAEIDIPQIPPQRYAPMTWDALRAAEKKGMEFGPHTVTHPILAQSSDEQVAAEVAQSWDRLQHEAQNPVPIFCYPNGQFSDFSGREIVLVRQAGMLGAVSGEPGYFYKDSIRQDPDEAFRVRRFSFPDEMTDLTQYVSGIERAKQILRGEV
ncbi:MAG: polysaccharide deacetylase family protein [Nitrospira sp.]|nr:polysaccharide deacetylase family protein [Nitrospira sp.]